MADAGKARGISCHELIAEIQAVPYGEIKGNILIF